MSITKLTISIALFGDIDYSADKWLDWFEYSMRKLKELEVPPNYIGLKGDSFKSGKVLQLNRAESKLKRVLARGEKVSSMDFYTLPENYVQAVFDYEAFLGRGLVGRAEHIVLTFNTDKASYVNIDETIDEMKQHIAFKSGEVFQMTNTDAPQLYTARVNPSSSFKSLKIIKMF